MRQNVKVVLFLSLFIFCCSAAWAGENNYYFSCEDLEAIKIYRAPLHMGISASNGDFPGGSYMVFFYLNAEAAQKYTDWIYEGQGNPFKAYLNGILYCDLREDGSEAFRLYLNHVPKFLIKEVGPTVAYATYDEALADAERYCPSKILRGEKNVLTVFPGERRPEESKK